MNSGQSFSGFPNPGVPCATCDCWIQSPESDAPQPDSRTNPQALSYNFLTGVAMAVSSHGSLSSGTNPLRSVGRFWRTTLV